MGESNIQAYQDKIKAVHRFEVVDSLGGPSLAGKRFHFIGAGGIGMSGLAQVLLKNKAIVSGSDQMASGVTDQLCRSGADIKIGHSENNPGGQMDAVVYSAAITEDNLELKSARVSGCKIYKYAQMLGELMSRYAGVAVAGTHGKSTTTGWLSYCLKRAGFEPSFIVGADVTQLGASSGVGDGEYFVAEACEYDRSFLNLKPKIGCILNIEQDHLDCYKDEDEIVDAFCQFALNVRPGGVLIANGEDSNVAKIMSRTAEHLLCETFGLDESCNYSARDVQL